MPKPARVTSSPLRRLSFTAATSASIARSAAEREKLVARVKSRYEEKEKLFGGEMMRWLERPDPTLLQPI